LASAFNAVSSFLQPIIPLSPQAPQAPPLQSPNAEVITNAEELPPIGDWNKPLLDLYQREKGKKTYKQLVKNEDMINYADDVAKYLLKNNPDLESKIKKAIANPTDKATLEPAGYRLYLPYLNPIFEKESANIPYVKNTSNPSEVSKFKKMFYARLKEQIFNPQELAIVNAQEQGAIVEEPPNTALSPPPVEPVSTTLTTNPPSISSPAP